MDDNKRVTMAGMDEALNHTNHYGLAVYNDDGMMFTSWANDLTIEEAKEQYGGFLIRSVNRLIENGITDITIKTIRAEGWNTYLYRHIITGLIAGNRSRPFEVKAAILDKDTEQPF